MMVDIKKSPLPAVLMDFFFPMLRRLFFGAGSGPSGRVEAEGAGWAGGVLGGGICHIASAASTFFFGAGGGPSGRVEALGAGWAGGVFGGGICNITSAAAAFLHSKLSINLILNTFSDWFLLISLYPFSGANPA